MPLSAAAISARILTATLPTFARTIAKLEHLVVEAEAPAHVVAAVIATDPTLTALTLGQAHAAGHATTNLNEAVRRIGQGVVLATARSAIPVAAAQRGMLAACWGQANAVATLTPILIEHRRSLLRGNWDTETLHLVGLVHDLGHVLAFSSFTEEYVRAALRLKKGETGFERVVGEEIGATPTQLAALAAHSWQLPPVLAAPMAHWRQPNLAPADQIELSAIVHVAHILAHAAGFDAGADRWVQPMDDWAISFLNLRISDCETVLDRMFESMDELELFEGALGG